MPIQDELVTRISLMDGYTSQAKKITAATKDLNTAVGAAGDDMPGFQSNMKLAFAELDSGTPILGEIVSILKSLIITATGAGIALAGFALYAMHSASELDSLRLGLTAYAGSTEVAANELKRLKEVARLPGLGVEEAVAGSTALQAVGFDARLAERALMGFGNALALVGKGKDDLDGVSVALSQMISKGIVSAEEINQIAERVPQIRQLMKAAFGTADTETIAKSTSPQQFILKIVDALATLPKAAGGAKNFFENMGDTFKSVINQIGDELNNELIPSFSKVTDFVDYLTDSGEWTNLVKGLSGVDGIGKSIVSTLREAADTLDNMARLVDMVGGKMATISLGAGFQELADILRFLGDSSGLGDGLIRVVSVAVATLEQIPGIIQLVFDIVSTNLQAIQGFVNTIIDAINQVLDTFLGKGIPLKIFGHDVGSFGGGGTLGKTYNHLEHVGFQVTPDQGQRAGQILGGIRDRAKDIYKGFQGYQQSNEVANDPSKGGFTQDDTMPSIARNTKEIADNTKKLSDIQERILGGGAVGAGAASAVNISKVLSGSSGRSAGSSSDPFEQASRVIADALRKAFGMAVGNELVAMSRNNPGLGGRR